MLHGIRHKINRIKIVRFRIVTQLSEIEAVDGSDMKKIK